MDAINSFYDPSATIALEGCGRSTRQLVQRPVTVYFHICCLTVWRDIVSKIYQEIKNSGLYDRIESIKCVVIGTADSANADSANADSANAWRTHPLFDDPKVVVLHTESGMESYEFPTLQYMWDDATCRCGRVWRDNLGGARPEGEWTEGSGAALPPSDILYLHSKGVKYGGLQPQITDWVDYLIYFNITRFETCLELLHGASGGVSDGRQRLDVRKVSVGVNLKTSPKIHYSGNFWWTTSEYIASLPRIEWTNKPTDAEFYIGQGTGVFYNLWESGVNHYHQRYEREKYRGPDHGPGHEQVRQPELWIKTAQGMWKS